MNAVKSRVGHMFAATSSINFHKVHHIFLNEICYYFFKLCLDDEST